MIRQNFKLFKSIKQCFLTYLIFISTSMGYILLGGLLQFNLEKNNMDVVGILQGTLSISLLAFIIFLYITYEYMALGRRCDTDECLCTLPTSKNMQEVIQFIICIILNFIYFIGMLLINIIFVFILHANSLEYILYITKVLIVYLFLTGVIAILIGGLLSHLKNSLFSYSFLVLLTFYFTIRFYQMFYNSEVLFGLRDFSQVFCVSAHYGVQYGYLFPLELHFIIKPFYVIGGLLLVLSCPFYKRRPNKKIVVSQVILMLCVICCIAIWKEPCSGCFYGYSDSEEDLYSNDMIEQASVENDFYVKEYKMNLNLKNGIRANVQMVLSNENCSEYRFTLFSQYKIESISDENGNELEYERNQNYLLIKNKDKSLKNITICYTGKQLNRYFAGTNGIYLPGNFPFYPIAGNLPVYEQGLCKLPSQESLFYVDINYDKKIYSNLDMGTKYVLEGQSNHLTIVSGFWKEKEIQGIDMIYPYISVNYNPELNTYLLDGILEYCKKDIAGKKIDYSLNGKKIIISPFGYEGGNYMFGSDTVIIGSKSDLDIFYFNYLSSGQWYIEDSVSDEEIQEILKDNPL